MTGIAIGVSALTGVAFGWWAVALVGALSIAILAIGCSRQRCETALAAFVIVVLAAWRADSTLTAGSDTAPPANAAAALVVSPPVRSGRFQYFVGEVESDDSPSGSRVCFTAPALPPLELGDALHLKTEIQARSDASVGRRAMLILRECDGSAFAPWVEISGTTGSPARLLSSMRTRLGESLRHAVPGDAGVLLSGLVTGDDSGFSPEREDALIATSTTHLTAVSGSNLALVAGILLMAGTAAVGRQRYWWQVLVIAGVWLYAAISGASPPAVRAAVVASLAVVAFWFGRRPDFPTLILLAAGAMVMLEPRQIDSLGFRLSVAASLALAWILPPLLERRSGWWGADLVVATSVAQLATLPFLLPIFGSVSASSLPANLIAAPLCAAITPIAAISAVGGLIYQPLGDALAAPAGLLARLLLRVLDLFAETGGTFAVGKPPTSAAVVLGVTAVAALLLGMTAQRRLLGGLAAAARLLVRRKDPHQAL
ncbi:MAG: ComEC/Rec2 family competence protein [Thermomicrobiales bacterium]